MKHFRLSWRGTEGSKNLDYNRYRLTLREWCFIGVKTAVLFLIVGYLFYDSAYIFVLFIPVLAVMALLEKKRCIRQRKHCLTQQFKEGIILLYSFVSTGSTLEQAFARAGQELLRTFQKDDDIVREFDEIRRKLGMNITVEACVADFAKRSHQEDIESFAQIISIAKRSGGSMSQIMKNSVETLKNKIESEAQIRTILSAKRGEFKLMVMIPLGVMFYMRVFSSGFMDVLYGNGAGILFMTICLFIYGGAILWGTKILDIQV